MTFVKQMYTAYKRGDVPNSALQWFHFSFGAVLYTCFEYTVVIFNDYRMEWFEPYEGPEKNGDEWIVPPIYIPPGCPEEAYARLIKEMEGFKHGFRGATKAGVLKGTHFFYGKDFAFLVLVWRSFQNCT